MKEKKKKQKSNARIYVRPKNAETKQKKCERKKDAHEKRTCNYVIAT